MLLDNWTDVFRSRATAKGMLYQVCCRASAHLTSGNSGRVIDKTNAANHIEVRHLREYATCE